MKFKGVKKEKRARKPRKVVEKPKEENKVEVTPTRREVSLSKQDKKRVEAKVPQIFPRIYRLITEPRMWIVTGMLVLVAISVSWLLSTIQRAEQIARSRQTLVVKEQQLLQKNAQYPGDKDILMRLAMVAYQLRDVKTAEKYIQAVYTIDPSYSPAHELERELTL